MLVRIFFLCLSALPINVLYANDSTLNWYEWKKSWDKREINTYRIAVERGRSLIGKIEVLDVRSDTERVGISTDDLHYPFEIVLDTPIEDLFNKKLSTTSAGQTLLLVIRNFWINKVQYIEGKPKGRQPVTGASLPSSKLTCSIDAFVKDGDGYSPLAQIDSFFTDKEQVTFSSRNLIEKGLTVAQNKLEEALMSKKYLTKKHRAVGFIERAYNRRFEIAALNDSVLKKGIYYTWDQFKNNKPTEDKFSIRSNRSEPPSLFITDKDGNEILTRDVFAVSDGLRLYKVHKGLVFPIVRNNNGIYWAGLEQYDQKKYTVPAAVPLGGGWYRAGFEPMAAVVKIRLTPYLLNLETGEEY